MPGHHHVRRHLPHGLGTGNHKVVAFEMVGERGTISQVEIDKRGTRAVSFHRYPSKHGNSIEHTRRIVVDTVIDVAGNRGSERRFDQDHGLDSNSISIELASHQASRVRPAAVSHNYNPARQAPLTGSTRNLPGGRGVFPTVNDGGGIPQTGEIVRHGLRPGPISHSPPNQDHVRPTATLSVSDLLLGVDVGCCQKSDQSRKDPMTQKPRAIVHSEDLAAHHRGTFK